MAFKLALTAGHYRYTAGKRCMKSLDPAETREWVLNARVAERVEALLHEYEGVEILRTDDRSGEKDVSLSARTTSANNFGADFYLSLHHNAGIRGGSGGGIVAYVYTDPSAEALAWQKALYDALIEATGLKGNRARPLAQSNLHEVREPQMPSVLLELGFMDSTTDTPILLTDDYARQCAEAIVSVIAKRAGLVKVAKTERSYRVQIGDYASRSEAEEMVKRLKEDGYRATVVAHEGATISAPLEPPPAREEVLSEKPLRVGDSVKVTPGAKNYDGKSLASFVYTRIHQIKELSGDRAVITYGGAVTAAMNSKDLYRV